MEGSSLTTLISCYKISHSVLGLLTPNAMDTNCKVCGGSHITGACTEKRKKEAERPPASIIVDEGDLTEEEVNQAVVDYNSRRAEWEQKQKGK